ncbi:hypothetical protein F2Q68_00008821 [Brassica cretica]|uniref:Uncharacterized protein n=1 Tax=Brassica cretica TaxID=69181 RepID=A0A8S9KMV3_BRACR|nr:hypothetical protein F2Q68_00008821 [Brassica cretica]
MLRSELVRRWSLKSGMSRMVMSKLNDKPEEIELLHQDHPRKKVDVRESPLLEITGLKKSRNFTDLMLKEHQLRTPSRKNIASGLISITLKCVGPSMGEKPPLTTDKLQVSVTYKV